MTHCTRQICDTGILAFEGRGVLYRCPNVRVSSLSWVCCPGELCLLLSVHVEVTLPWHQNKPDLLFPLSCNRQRRLDSCWLLCVRGRLIAQGHLASYQCTLLPTCYAGDLNRRRSVSQAKIQTNKNENAKEWVTLIWRHWFHRTVEQREDCLDSNWCTPWLPGQLFERHVWSTSASLRMWKMSPNPTYFSLLVELSCTSGVNKGVNVTLTAVWQISTHLCCTGSVLISDCWLEELVAHWRRKTGVSPDNRLTPFIPVPALFTEHGQLTWQLRIPTHLPGSSSWRAASLHVTASKTCPLIIVKLFVWAKVRMLLWGEHILSSSSEGLGDGLRLWKCSQRCQIITSAQCWENGLTLGHTHMVSTRTWRFWG